MKHILILPSWFPTRVTPLAGDFIERHAIAISRYHKVTVLFTVKDVTARKAEWAELKFNNNFTAWIYYYPGLNIPFVKKVAAARQRFSILKQKFEELFTKKMPDLVHVHVAYPAGLFALYLKKTKKLNYVLSEQNGMYMPQYDHFHKPGYFERKATKMIFSGATAVHAVSKALADALINLKLVTRQPVVIPNVVDTDWFNYSAQNKNGLVHFIHVSTLTNQKNPDGMLKALAMVKEKRSDFTLTVIGPVTKQLRLLTKKLGLNDHVKYAGEATYQGVANGIKKSDAMLFFTRYETFGCVIAESLCCGVPVIVSDLDVTRENITDLHNGILVQPGNEKDLAGKILAFMNGDYSFNQVQIAEEAKDKFNYERVGKMFDEWYNSLLP
jgi:glycosyltransferase involved in cell wall biosynthesis